ncbi:MAG TPA: LuxR C-terminal-related transcriptional regulator [Dehalococcoidia bacterium]
MQGFADPAVSLEVFVDLVKRTAIGSVAVSPLLSQTLTRTLQGRAPERGVSDTRTRDSGIVSPAVLSPREEAVLQLVAAGHPNGEVGEQLGLSVHTVRAHLRNISRKLGTRNRVHAVTRGLRANDKPTRSRTELIAAVAHPAE